MTNKRVLSKQEKQARKSFKEAKKECGKSWYQWQYALEIRELCEDMLRQTSELFNRTSEQKLKKLPDNFFEHYSQETIEILKNALEEEEKYKNLFLQWHILVRRWKAVLA